MASRPPQGYQAQVNPSAAAPLPATSAEAAGAGIGRALEQIGAEAHRGQVQGHVRERQLNADREWAEFQRRYAEGRENIAGYTRQARLEADVGHTEKVGKAWTTLRDGLVDGITDRDVLRKAEVVLKDFGSRLRTAEADFEVLAVGKRNVENVRDTLNVAANRTRRLESPEDFAEEQKAMYGLIEGLASVDRDTREALLEEADQVLAVSFLQGMTDRDPVMAKGLLDSGAYDEVLTPQQVEALRNGTEVEIRRAEAEAERQQAQQVAAFKGQVRQVKELDRQGIDVSEYLPQLAQQAAALGDQTLALELDGMAANSAFARIYEGQPPVVIERRIAALRGVDNPNAQQQRELKWLTEKQGALGQRFDSDPVGFAISKGGANAPPVIDFQDPATLAERGRWAQTYSEAVGRPVPPLTKAEAAGLKANFEAGRSGEVEVMDLLSRMPAREAALAAKQIAPNDPELAVMVTLPKGSRDLAQAGKEILRADRSFISKQVKEDLDLSEATSAITAQYTNALRSLGPTRRSAIHDTALRIMAGAMDKHGAPPRADLWRQSLHLALGGTGRFGQGKGGFGHWADDNWFLVPPGMTQTEFAQAAFRAAAKGRNRPVNPDGSPASLRQLVPVAVGPGEYEWRTRSGEVVRDGKGRPWIFEVPR